MPDSATNAPDVPLALLEACNVLPHAWGEAPGTGTLKSHPDDFVVEEDLGFEPDGEGEHLFVEVEKRGLGTLEVQRQLATRFHLPLKRVSFSGMKDRQALTRQWFSLQLGVKAAREQSGIVVAQAELQGSGARILQAVPNRRKLQRGSHRQNRFRLRIRDFQGDADAVRERWQHLQQGGAPNYFGPQRFGNGGSTLLQAWQAAARGMLPAARSARSLQLSAARAFLFNRVLAVRVADGSWNHARAGDLMQLAGSASLFAAVREAPHRLEARLASCDVHVSGPLWGAGASAVDADVGRLEADTVGRWPALCALLENAGLTQERRALRMVPGEASLECEGSCMQLAFTLARGSYATSLLRELLQLTTIEPTH